MNCLCGMRFSHRNRKKLCTWSRKNPEQSSKGQKSEEMIPVLAEAERNINIAVEDKEEYSYSGMYMALFLFFLGLFCIGYYIAGVTYAGFSVSMIWIWLAGGITLIFLGGLIIYCKRHGITQEIPFSVKCMAGTGVVCAMILFLVMEGLILSGMSQKGKPDLDYLVVLGCQVKGEHPSKALRERLETAQAYLEEYPETKAVLSGGQGPGEEISEAECMFRYLTKAGISRERLVKEDLSTTTVENLEFSKKFFDQERDTVGIVTNNFHVYRSMRIAKKAGYLQMCGIAAPSRTVLQLHYLVRECFALTKEILQKNI